MFLSNKYSKWYYNIINNARNRDTVSGYYEQHHIVPKSLGGTDDLDNLVNLTAREHFLCHMLLVKMCVGGDKAKMAYAAWQLSRPRNHKNLKVTSKTYEMLRTDLSKSMTGRKREPFSEEWKTNMSISAYNRKKVPCSEKMKEHLRSLVAKRGSYLKENNPFYGKTHSKESKEKIGASSRARFLGVPKEKKQCIHCGREFAPNMLNRWHNDNCKFKK